MGSTGTPRVVAGLDETRQYTEDEDRRLAANLYGILRRVDRGGYLGRALGLPLLCEIHRELFDDVRGHAGRIRSEEFGSERLHFGPNRSPHRADVPAHVRNAFDEARPLLLALEQDPTADDFEERAIHLTTWLHARIIEIHPFEDGNGRACRALMSVILVRLGMLPFPFELPKEEYREALNHFFRSNDMVPLADLTIRLYSDALPEREMSGPEEDGSK